MKKIFSSIIASIAVSTFVVAGGDIAPVEPVVETPAIVSNPLQYYIGAGYSNMNVDSTGDNSIQNAILLDATSSMDADNYLLLAGIQFNEYLAIEGRYSNSLNDVKATTFGRESTLPDSEIESYGIYLKPMYPVADKMNIYALLGYANVKISDIGGDFMDDGGFSYGIGASYSITERLSVFADYVRLYDDTYSDGTDFYAGAKVEVDSINIGVTYKF